VEGDKGGEGGTRSGEKACKIFNMEEKGKTVELEALFLFQSSPSWTFPFAPLLKEGKKRKEEEEGRSTIGMAEQRREGEKEWDSQ